MSLEAAWNSYENKCVCEHRYDNNCAHFLSNALILGKFSILDGGKGGNFRTVNDFCVCRSGRPVRAFELRGMFFAKHWSLHSTPPRDGICLVFQKKDERVRHVLMKRYKDGKQIGFKGTGDFAEWPVEEFYY